MSKKYNRAITKSVTNNHEYVIKTLKFYIGPYHEGYNENHHGQYKNQLRSYKSWKHNRKKQYKEMNKNKNAL